MTAAEKIKKAIDQNPDHDEEGLTQVDARWNAEVALAANQTTIVKALAWGAAGALRHRPEGVATWVFCKTHDLRHLLEQAKAPTAAEVTDGPAQ